MDFELISEADFRNLPEDNEQCFVQFETICRRNMARMMKGDIGQYLARSIQAQYMASVSAVAVECGFDHLAVSSFTENDDAFYDTFSDFSLRAQGEVARIRVRNRRSRSAFSVQLTDNTRTKIRFHISLLRNSIDESDLSTSTKQALRDKIIELENELNDHRISLGKAMAILSFVLVGLASTVTIGAEGPAAITNIMKLISLDKQGEEAATARLAPPQKALPAPGNPRIGPSDAETAVNINRSDLEDEIPF